MQGSVLGIELSSPSDKLYLPPQMFSQGFEYKKGTEQESWAGCFTSWLDLFIFLFGSVLKLFHT